MPLLPGLALLPLLSGLALLPLLPVAAQLAILRKLLHLLLELLGFPPQHLLFPALLGGLLALARLFRQFLLALGKLFQLLQHVVHFALARVGRLRLAAALVLVLFGIELQVEQALHIARGAAHAAATPAAALPEGHLNIAEGGESALQVLQRLLFGRQRILPFPSLQIVGSRPHLLPRPDPGRSRRS